MNFLQYIYIYIHILLKLYSLILDAKLLIYMNHVDFFFLIEKVYKHKKIN